MIKRISLALVSVLALALLVQSCEPGGFPVIENQRNDQVEIFITLVRVNGTPVPPEKPLDYGNVLALSTKKLASITFIRRDWVFNIQAVDTSGNVVFSHNYNWNDLEKIGWKIVIPPS